MPHRTALATLGIALALSGAAVGCRDRGKAELHATARRAREAVGLRASLARLERGESILPEDE